MEVGIRQLYSQEKKKWQLDEAGAEIEKAENLIVHEDEIKSRPARTWHQTETQKTEIKNASRDLVKPDSVKRKKQAERFDEYKDEVAEGKDRDHRLSRKKRRRIEAVKADAEDRANPHAMAPKPVKKEKVLPQFYEEGLMSTIGLHRNKKVARPKFAVGGADQDFFNTESDGKVRYILIYNLHCRDHFLYYMEKIYYII